MLRGTQTTCGRALVGLRRSRVDERENHVQSPQRSAHRGQEERGDSYIDRSAVTSRAIPDHESLRGKYPEKIEGKCEDSRIGLLHAMFERQDEMVDESVNSQLGELRAQVKVNIADYRNPYAERLDALKCPRHVLEHGMSDYFSVETVQSLGKLWFQIGLSV